MISQIYRGAYRLRGKTSRTLYSEYWLPSKELGNDPSLRVIIEGRVYEELARYFRESELPGEPPFDPSLIRGQWFSYDWDTKRFYGAPADVPPPDERMRG